MGEHNWFNSFGFKSFMLGIIAGLMLAVVLNVASDFSAKALVYYFHGR